MDDRLKKLEIKRLLQEYNFILTDIEYKTEVISENKISFLEKADKVKRELFPEEVPPVTPSSEDTPTEKPKDPGPIISESTKSKIKKLYREIVKITHPDKNDSSKYLEQHMRATKASEEYNLFELYSICLDLNIPAELDSDDLDILIKLLEDKRKQNKSLEGSFIWLWINTNADPDKETVVTAFVKQTHSR
jgi:hypothetical protein